MQQKLYLLKYWEVFLTNVKQIFAFMLLVNICMMLAHSKQKINSANRQKKNNHKQIILQAVKVQAAVSAHTYPCTLRIMKIRHPNGTTIKGLQKLQAPATEQFFFKTKRAIRQTLVKGVIYKSEGTAQTPLFSTCSPR